MSELQSPGPIRRVALLTLGCKLNQAESETIARDLMAAREASRPKALKTAAKEMAKLAQTPVFWR